MNTLPPKYRPKQIKNHSWEQIERFYEELILKGWNIQPMLSLVKYIRSCELKDRLFGYTSLSKLFLSIYDPSEFQREQLLVEFNIPDKTWHFIYYSMPFEQIEHEQKCPEDSGIEEFCNYVDLLKW